MANPSTIQILHTPVGGGPVDITQRVLYAESRFEVVASAMPGTATIVLKDPNRELDFTTGDEIALIIDDVRLWGGLLMDKGEGHFFAVVDTTDLNAVHDLKWTLNCVDYNIWMDKLVIRDPIGDPTANPPRQPYLDAIEVGPGLLGAVLREVIPQYMDVPPGFDYETYVEDTDYRWEAPDIKNPDGTPIGRPGGPAPLRDQGTKWRVQLDEVTHLGGYEWRIDADKRLHITKISALQAPWGFVDHRPNGSTSIGFREGTIREDGSQMVTDALIWGGRANQLEDAPLEQEAVFARYPDPPASNETAHGVAMPLWQEQQAIQRITQFGRWQRGEVKIGDPYYFDQGAVDLRAYAIVAGPETGTNEVNGLDNGLNRPVWQISLSWFAHDVPGKVHLIPGQFVPLVFWTMDGENGPPLTLFLPLRHLNISFPTLPPSLPGDEPMTYVRFDGEFGIAYSDSRYMWRFLRSRMENPETILASVGQTSERAIAGAVAGFYPETVPNGSRTQFTLPHTYLAGTTQVYLNGLLQRPRYEYVESSPSQGIITFMTAPFADDTIWIVCRTGAG